MSVTSQRARAMETGSPGRQGFTMTELMVAFTISMLVIAGILATFLTQVKQYRQFRDLTEARQDAESGLHRVMRDVRLAGYGLPISDGELPYWITWLPGTTNVVSYIPAYKSQPDRLRVCGAFEPAVAWLRSGITRGDTVLHLGSGQGAAFNTVTRKVIFIGRLELARVVSVSGDDLRISTHPSLAGRGLRYEHESGAQVELIEAVEYICETSFTNSLGRPYLYRKDYGGTLTNRLQQLVAMGIEDLQVSESREVVTISVTGVSQRPELRYKHPVKGDAYRRVTVSGTATIRNRED